MKAIQLAVCAFVCAIPTLALALPPLSHDAPLAPSGAHVTPTAPASEPASHVSAVGSKPTLARTAGNVTPLRTTAPAARAVQSPRADAVRSSAVSPKVVVVKVANAAPKDTAPASAPPDVTAQKTYDRLVGTYGSVDAARATKGSGVEALGPQQLSGAPKQVYEQLNAIGWVAGGGYAYKMNAQGDVVVYGRFLSGSAQSRMTNEMRAYVFDSKGQLIASGRTANGGGASRGAPSDGLTWDAKPSLDSLEELRNTRPHP
jgi:hypothetical protein